MSKDNQHTRFAAIFAGGTLFSRALGLVRDLVWVNLIPTRALDAFLIAFRFPNMLRELVGEGASNAAFVPVIAESHEKESEEKFRALVSAAMGGMILLLAVLTILGVLIVPFLLNSLDLLRVFTKADALEQTQVDLMISLARWTFPYLFFIGLAVFCMAPLFTLGHYGTPAWSPALLNVSIILCCLFLHDRFAEPAHALVLGVWLGGIAQLFVQYLALGRVAGVWLPSFRLRHPGLRQMMMLMIPVVIGQSAGEVNRLLDALFAASLPEAGTVRALYLANRLVQLPLSVFGVAIAVSILPTAARAAARQDFTEIRQTLSSALRRSYFFVFPAMLGLMVLGDEIIRLLFQHGENFDSVQTDRTYSALLFYCSGLLFFAWVKVCVTGFYAIKDTRTPVIIASGSMLLNIVLNAALVGPMGFRGLALATTLSFAVNFVLLFVFLSRRFGPLWSKSLLGGLARMSAAGVMMAGSIYGAARFLDGALEADTILMHAIQVIAPLGVGALVYGILVALLRLPEFAQLKSLFRA